MTEVFFTCSLGTQCFSAKLLQRNKCKMYSYPFDWIFLNCDNVIHCIENNFNIFLSRQNNAGTQYMALLVVILVPIPIQKFYLITIIHSQL